MQVNFKKLGEASEEAKMLSLAIRFYDYYSDVPNTAEYWDEVLGSAKKVCDMFKGGPLEQEVLKIMLGMCDALEVKGKNAGK